MTQQAVLSRASWNLAFSGAGHLISYHLGVAKTLQNSNKTAAIKSVAGSSSGAVAAAVLACIPHQLEEYTDRFLQDGGRAFANFREMLVDTYTVDQSSIICEGRPTLHIATTKCSDGSFKIFSFEPDNMQNQHRKLLVALQASCKIPLLFHPWDAFSKHAPSYPEHDGIEIDGDFYVDGGISCPCPIVPTDDDATNISISPISGSSLTKCHAIRPNDNSWKAPLLSDVVARCGTFAVRPSVDNLRALFASAGAASPRVLKDWHDRGVDDAYLFLGQWNKDK